MKPAEYVIIIFVLFLVSVVLYTGNNDVSDNRLTKTHDWTFEEIEVVVHVYPSPKEVTEAYWVFHEDKYGKITDDYERLGWAGWNEEQHYCEIHTVDIKTINDNEAMETLGHEMVHCLYGSWHTEVY